MSKKHSPDRSDPKNSGAGGAKLSILLDIAEALSATPSLKSSVRRSFEALCKGLGAPSAFLVLTDEETGDLRVGASCGLDEEKARRVVYRPGEGIVGRVVK